MKNYNYTNFQNHQTISSRSLLPRPSAPKRKEKDQNQRTVGSGYLNLEKQPVFHERTDRELMVIKPVIWVFSNPFENCGYIYQKLVLWRIFVLEANDGS
jgi:hypothetical protein